MLINCPLSHRSNFRLIILHEKGFVVWLNFQLDHVCTGLPKQFVNSVSYSGQLLEHHRLRWTVPGQRRQSKQNKKNLPLWKKNLAHKFIDRWSSQKTIGPLFFCQFKVDFSVEQNNNNKCVAVSEVPIEFQTRLNFVKSIQRWLFSQLYNQKSFFWQTDVASQLKMFFWCFFLIFVVKISVVELGCWNHKWKTPFFSENHKRQLCVCFQKYFGHRTIPCF